MDGVVNKNYLGVVESDREALDYPFSIKYDFDRDSAFVLEVLEDRGY